MTQTSTAPAWAVAMIEEVCKDYNRALPKQFSWYNTKSKDSSGRTYMSGKRLHVSAGTDVADQKLMLIHELAHHILAKTRTGRKAHHSLKYWRLHFELADKYGDGAEKHYEREYVAFNVWRTMLGSEQRAKAKWAYDERKVKA